MAQTLIGSFKLRTEFAAHGKLSDGSERLCLNFIPNKRVEYCRGKYAYQHLQPSSSYRQWLTRNAFTDGWEESKTHGTFNRPPEPKALRRALEAIAYEFDCDVFLNAQQEQLDPWARNPQRVWWYNVHFSGLPEIRDVPKFLQALASRIDRIVKEQDSRPSEWPEYVGP